MKYLTLNTLCLALMLAAPVPFAAAAEPSDASIDELMKLGKADQVMNLIAAQVDKAMDQAVQTARPAGELTAPQQAVIQKMHDQMREAQQQFLNYDQFKPVMIRVYKQSFTQAELDGILKFYRTPAGRALIDKMPLVMQNSMREMQPMMKPYMERLQRIQQDAMHELHAEHEAPDAKP